MDVKAAWCQAGESLNARSRWVALGKPLVALTEVWHNEGQVCHPQGGPTSGQSWVFLVDP